MLTLLFKVSEAGPVERLNGPRLRVDARGTGTESIVGVIVTVNSSMLRSADNVADDGVSRPFV